MGLRGFQGGSTVKNTPADVEMWAWSLGREDPLEKEWQPTPGFLPGKIPWMEEPGGLQPVGLQSTPHDVTAAEHTHMGSN